MDPVKVAEYLVRDQETDQLVRTSDLFCPFHAEGERAKLIKVTTGYTCPVCYEHVIGPDGGEQE